MLPTPTDFSVFAFVTMLKLTVNRSILPILMIAVLFGCRQDPTNVATFPVESLRVAAASDLQPWLEQELKAWGARKSPPISVDTLYGSSYQLAAQIRSGAPVDLFLSADAGAVEELAQEGHIFSDSKRPYAKGRLSLLYRKPLIVMRLDELPKLPFDRLVIASPETAPYGKAARAALESAGVAEAISARLVIAPTVRQALRSVIDGNAEVGVVSRGHAMEAAAAIADLSSIEIPAHLHPPIIQVLGIVKDAKDRSAPSPAAVELAEWLTSPATDELFRSHGLERPSR